MSDSTFTERRASGRGPGTTRPFVLQGREDAFDAVPDESPIMEYVKVLYKRRWTAVTVFLVVRIVHGLHVHRHADLRGADPAAHRERGPERRRLQAGGRGGPADRRLLPDAVQHPAEPRPGPPDDRRVEAVERPQLRRKTGRRVVPFMTPVARFQPVPRTPDARPCRTPTKRAGSRRRSTDFWRTSP